MNVFEQLARYRDTPGALDPYVLPDATTPLAISGDSGHPLTGRAEN